MSEEKSRLHAVNQSDGTLDAIDRRSAWASFLPLKMRLSIGVALALVSGLLFEDRVLNESGARWPPVFYAAVAVVILLLGAVMTLIDHLTTRRRRANKRPPASFG